ncbi:MAG: PQQ-binding-like beta-propeller repeat protein [Verrucomicrobiales bacterium]|nr:PQQ-binding-like beta-propeller repeat protein [Verrucomicrobiales bacterium]
MKKLPLLPCLLLLLDFAISAPANDWPSWRGPGGDGKLPDATTYPTQWSAKEHIAWRVDLPDRGNSSPVVFGNRVFLTQSENKGQQRSLICFDAKDGKTLWKKTIDYGKIEETHQTNPHCPASPVTDGTLVFAWHGNAGLHAYDFEGNEKWSRDLGTDYAHIWGPHAASPVLLGSGLIIHAGPGPVAKLIALHKDSGKTIWETDLDAFESADAKQFKGSWATPLVIDNAGRAEILLGLPGFLMSYDPKSGKELWRAGGLGDLCYTNVLTGNGRALYLCGYGGPGIGLKLPGATETGDLTASHRLWADPPKGKGQNPQRIGSGQIIGDHLYLLNEPGVMQCSLVETGEILWRERLSGSSWSSMNLIGKTLYVNDARGTTYLIEPDPKALKVIATNPVDENQHTNASLAFAGGRIYLRTDMFLYAVE